VQGGIDDHTAATITLTAKEIPATAIEGHIGQFATTTKPIDGGNLHAMALHEMQISNAPKMRYLFD
jgi:hypothetical protein